MRNISFEWSWTLLKSRTDWTVNSVLTKQSHEFCLSVPSINSRALKTTIWTEKLHQFKYRLIYPWFSVKWQDHTVCCMCQYPSMYVELRLHACTSRVHYTQHKHTVSPSSHISVTQGSAVREMTRLYTQDLTTSRGHGQLPCTFPTASISTPTAPPTPPYLHPRTDGQKGGARHA